jgi:hypothetical protein
MQQAAASWFETRGIAALLTMRDCLLDDSLDLILRRSRSGRLEG